MPISFKHLFQSAKTNSPDTTLVQPSNWNAEHTLTLGAGKVIGRLAGADGAAQELNLSFDATQQSMVIPSGTTAQRPATPVAGMVRFNSTLNKFETYSGTAWEGSTELATPLLSIGGVVTVADRMLYTTAADTYAATPLTPFARTLLDDLDQTAARGTLGAQAADAELSAIAGLAATGFISHTGVGTAAERTIAAGDGIAVTDGGGVAGNPTITSLGVGIGQTWQDMTASRGMGVNYQNLTTKPIMVVAYSTTNTTCSMAAEISDDAVTWISVRYFASSVLALGSVHFTGVIIPVNDFYRLRLISGTAPTLVWSELR